MKPSRDISRWIEIIAACRTRHIGFPWELAPNLESIALYTTDESHDVADATQRGDYAVLKKTAGDL